MAVENRAEQWVPEVRLDDTYQVPDFAHKTDAKSFDYRGEKSA